MNQTTINNWQGVHDEVLRRIHNRDWKPGELIPKEADLSREFGCARTTVNRALQTLAENGILDRKRKAGTRVTLHRVAKAMLSIPVIRHEIEEKSQAYGYKLISQTICAPPPKVKMVIGTESGVDLLHIKALHFADRAPYVIEDRWINLDAVREARSADFSRLSANEWLVLNTPHTHGEIGFGACNATDEVAELLGASKGEALFQLHRTTYDRDDAITTVKLIYKAGYELKTSI